MPRTSRKLAQPTSVMLVNDSAIVVDFGGAAAVGRAVGIDEGRTGGDVEAGLAVGFLVGFPEGAGIGARVGTCEGKAVGVAVGTFEGTDVGASVGRREGTDVGAGVGGREYSTTVVVALTVALFVAFLFTVMVTPVTFAVATPVVKCVVKLPLVTADDICEDKLLVKFAALPLNAVKRRPSSSLLRATMPSRRISRRNITSTSFVEEAPVDVVTFAACTSVTWSTDVTNDRTFTTTCLMTVAMVSVNVLGVKPPRRMCDSSVTKRKGA